jgi:hypothetical protein
MSLTSVALALLTRVRAYSGGAMFVAGNSSYAEYTVLDAVGYEVCAIVDVAGDSVVNPSLPDGARQAGAQGKLMELHDLSVTVAYKRGAGVGGDGALKQALTTLTDALLADLVRYPRLNNTTGVTKAQVIRRNTPYDIAPAQPENAPSTHLAQDLFVRVWTETTPNYAEGY